MLRRRFIQNLADSPVKPAGAAPDAALHAAVLAGGTVVCIRKCYMHKKLGNPTLDPLRCADALVGGLVKGVGGVGVTAVLVVIVDGSGGR